MTEETEKPGRPVLVIDRAHPDDPPKTALAWPVNKMAIVVEYSDGRREAVMPNFVYTPAEWEAELRVRASAKEQK